MRKPKIIFDFLRNNDPRIEIQTNSILACMTGNVHYENPSPTLEEMNAVLLQYSVSLSAAQNRGRIHVKQKEKDRAILELQLKRLANYVMLTAGDDRAIMASSGFTLNAETSSKTEMGEVKGFEVAVGQVSGEATMSVLPLKGAFYIFYWALAATPLVWEHKPSWYPTIKITGLQPLTTYVFRVLALGIGDKTSDTVNITKGVL